MAEERSLGFYADIFSLGVTVIEMIKGESPRISKVNMTKERKERKKKNKIS